MPDRADPLQPRSTCFVFPVCQVERERRSGTLVVTMPAHDLSWRGARVEASAPGISWTDRKRLSTATVEVLCDPSPAARFDRMGYPRQTRYSDPKLSVSFRGPVCYGRIPRGEAWALAVHACVDRGGPVGDDWSQYDAVEFDCAPPAGRARRLRKSSPALAMSGPYDPFP
jgi:hypothetical protein